MEIHATLPEKGRDLRLDFFRGIANWWIFLDHIPNNVINWATPRNYGFSDAADLFVFISGYTAVIAYSRMMEQEGWTRAAARIYRRVWQLYVAHILLFVAFSAQIAWVSIARDTPALIEEALTKALPTLSAATAQKAPRQPMKGSSASSGADAVTAPSAPQDMM